MKFTLPHNKQQAGALDWACDVDWGLVFHCMVHVVLVQSRYLV